MIQEINRDYKTAFIMVTHDQNLAMKAKRLLELKDGLIIKDRDMQSLRQEELWLDDVPDCCLSCKNKFRGNSPF